MTKILLICYTILSVASLLPAQNSEVRIEIDYDGNFMDTKFISRDSLILITGFQSTVSLLINTNNNSVSAIDPRIDFPGFNFMAVETQFYDDRILYTNGGPWGFTISLDNKDVQELDRFFMAPNDIVSVPNKDYFFGFHARESTLFPKPILIKYNYNGISIDTTHYFDFRLPNILSSFDEFNLVHIDDTFIFTNPLDNELLLFNINGEYLRTIPLKFEGWNTVKSDIKTAGDSPSMFRNFNTSEATFIRKIYKLNNNNDVLIQYYSTSNRLYNYCILEGVSYTRKACFDGDVSNKIIGAIANYLYYISYEDDKTYLVGKHISEFLD